jgi:tetratricopeptide (TPR) repeat protein
MEEGEYDRAISEFTNALEIDPGIANTYGNRGGAYLATSQIDQAIADFSKAVEIDPKSSHIYSNRAFAYRVKGEYDKAWQDVHKAQSLGMQLDPDFLKGLREASGRER